MSIQERLFLKVQQDYPGLIACKYKEVGVHLYDVLVKHPEGKWIAITFMKTADDTFTPVGVSDLNSKYEF